MTDVSHRDAVLVDLPFADAGRTPSLVDELLRGDVDVALIRGVLRDDEASLVVDRLEGRRLQFPETSFPPQFNAHFFGSCLDLAAPSLETYFADAERYRSAAAALFEGMTDFPTRVRALFGAISAGRLIEVPRGPSGSAYVHSTIRHMHDGGYIPPHCEREQARRPPYAHLRELLRPESMMSFYLVLAAPEAGGELCISSLRFSDLRESDMRNERTNVAGLAANMPFDAFTPAVGDVILFYGGERIHWISPCRGARVRYTMGGFAAPSRGGDTLFFWS